MERFISIFLVLYIISSFATYSLAESADERLDRIERMLSAKIELLQNELRNQNVVIGSLVNELGNQNVEMQLLRTRVLKRELQNCNLQNTDENKSNGKHDDAEVSIQTEGDSKTRENTSSDYKYPINDSFWQNRIQRNEELKRNRRLLVQPTVASSQMNPVAFYAYLSASEADPGHHFTIIFDHVVTNAGNGYNVHSGTFIAPEDGIYVFSYSVVSYAGKRMPVELVVNSKAVGATAADSISDSPNPSASNTLVVQLQAGSTVFLRTTTTTGWTVGSLYSSAWSRSSFSGWKLQ